MQHRPGGNATIGAAIAAKAPADGYTYVIVTATHVISSLLMKVPYDPIRDFAAVSPVSVIETVVVAHPSLPAKNLKELVALAKAKLGQLNYATASFGSSSHLGAELLGMRMGIKLQNIAYKGGSPRDHRCAGRPGRASLSREAHPHHRAVPARQRGGLGTA